MNVLVCDEKLCPRNGSDLGKKMCMCYVVERYLRQTEGPNMVTRKMRSRMVRQSSALLLLWLVIVVGCTWYITRWQQ